MKRKIGHDGTFWVSSNIKTSESRVVSFWFAWETVPSEISKRIVHKYPKFFVFENNSDLWVKETADTIVNLNELIDATSMNNLEGIALIDDNTNEVIAGVKNWIDPTDIK